jgi:hypothetical protein
MSNSPWSSYGRVPLGSENSDAGDKRSAVAGVVKEVMRGREQLDKYLNGALREYFEIQSGNSGYRNIITDALTPSDRPETIEERLSRLAREAQSRRSAPPLRKPRSR